MELNAKKLNAGKLANAVNKRRAKDGPTAETTAGPVVGRYKAKGEISFFGGVPYAAPPVGDRRWRPPAPVTPWTEPRLCTKPGAMAFQRAQNIDLFFDQLVVGLGLSAARQKTLKTALKVAPTKQSEDCLTLAVRSPTGAENLPVMVWIHGGDHTDGSGSEVMYAGEALPQRGCVLVNINYRLGLFGFLAHPELSSESPDGVSGNYGLLDQIAALEWVRDNIANFGGDPDQVTIFGESAGGQAVLNLMTAPKARGLFHRAIAQSPSDSGRWLHLRNSSVGLDPAETAGQSFANLAVGEEPMQMARLRSMDPDALSELYRANTDLGRHFYPAIDGEVLPQAPVSAFTDGATAQVPLMIGYNADEGSLLYPFMNPAGAEFPLDETASPSEIRQVFERSYGSAAAVDELFAAYPGLEQLEPAALEAHAGDHMFGVHVDHVSRQHAARAQPVYRYHFRAVPASPTQTAGAFHAAEITYVFGTSLPLVPDGDGAHLLTREMGDRWFAFAATGVPDSPGRSRWPKYDPAQPVQMVFDRPTSGVEPCPPQPGLELMASRVDRLGTAGEASVVDLTDQPTGTTIW